MEFQLVLFLISIGLQAIGALFTDFTNDWDESGNVSTMICIHFSLFLSWFLFEVLGTPSFSSLWKRLTDLGVEQR